MDIKNISMNGIGFEFPKAPSIFKTNSIINGEVKVNNESCLLVLNIRHITQNTVGCFVENHDATYEHLIESFINNRISKLKLQCRSNNEISPQQIEKIFTSEDNQCGFSFTAIDNTIQSISLNLLGNIISISKDSLISGPSNCYFLKAPQKLNNNKSSEISAEVFNQAIILIDNIIDLSDNEKDEVYKILENARYLGPI